MLLSIEWLSQWIRNLICGVATFELNLLALRTLSYITVLDIDVLSPLVDSRVICEILGPIVVDSDRYSGLLTGLQGKITNKSVQPYCFFCGKAACDILCFT